MRTTSSKLVKGLIDNLWGQYLQRVPYARKYADLVTAKGGHVVHDHLAFRTLNTPTGEQPAGIAALAHIFETLHYKRAGKYRFPNIHVNAVHLEHPDPLLPRIFISQLDVDEMPDWVKQVVRDTVHDAPYLLSEQAIELMNIVGKSGSITQEAATILIEELTGYFRLPWILPTRDNLLNINDVSQYAAWTLLHGNAVNHFAANINLQQVPEWPDIETTIGVLSEAGIPFKDTVEGDRNSILRQSATAAVKESFRLKDSDGEFRELEWTYAYYEFTERGFYMSDEGEKLFGGFIADQATQLFKMTETRDN